LRVLRKGPARPLASMPYWRKISAVRSPTMREVPNGFERYIPLWMLSCLPAILERRIFIVLLDVSLRSGPSCP
jgi:hypothetical protein